MSDKSSIEWLNGGSTWNPLRARNRATGQVGWFCVHASAGCENCYAEQRNKGFFQLGTRVDYKAQNQKKVEIFLDEQTLKQPLHWKKPRLVFPCSMTDLFGEFHTDGQIEKVFNVMYRAKAHTFIVLTKRAERMYDFVSKSAFLSNAPLDNVWFLVSVEDQKNADERIPWLLKTPAAVRGVSYEPALGPVDFCGLKGGTFDGLSGRDFEQIFGDDMTPSLDWLIIGGESGPRARPFDVQWARDVIKQCKAAGTSCFVKQVGGAPGFTSGSLDRQGKPFTTLSPLYLHDSKGGDWNEWPEDLRVRQYPREIPQ